MKKRHATSPGTIAGATLAAILSVAALSVSGCATNPATGKKQLSLYGTESEIEIGRNADQQFVQTYGLVEDESLARYVSELGKELAAKSERPDLPWTFRVADDSAVNAFALPGGYIYVTRGILTHLSSEAELAGVLGHEIGHVTARHSINQISKAQFAQLGLVAGIIAAPELAQQFGGLAQQGLGLMFLKFGRDDERQADDLGFRYMSRAGYPPAALNEVFSVLGAVGDAAGAERLPNWLSTHPAPEDRQRSTTERLGDVGPELANASWQRQPYLDRVDGLVYGADPREGFVKDDTFYHPELAFRLDVPRGWKTTNQRQYFAALSPEQDAVMVLSLVEGDDPRAAAQQFFRDNQGVESGGAWLDNRSGLGTVSDRIRVVQNGQEQLRGGVAFTRYDGRVYRLLAYGKPDRWSRNQGDLERAVASFAPLRERRYLDVQPRRLKVVRVDRAMTLREFDRRYPSSVDIEELALINHAEPDARIDAGTLVKQVVGEDPTR